MSKKKKNFVSLGAEDVEHIISLAKGFYVTEKQSIFHYVRCKKKEKVFDNNLLAVAATNITLSFELNLKALILITTGRYETGHAIKLLYYALPSEIQVNINVLFKKGQLKVRGDMPIIRRLSPLPGELAEYNPWSVDTRIEEFLDVHSDGFVESRYHFNRSCKRLSMPILV